MGAKSIRMVWQRMMLSRFIMFTVKSIRGIFYRRYRQGAPALLKHHCLTCVNCRYKGRGQLFHCCKSIICQTLLYFKGFVRYIYLDP
jgi:hypothetical protein